METTSSSAGNIDLLRQDILDKIGEIIIKEKGGDHNETLEVTKKIYQKKLQTASIQYRITRPITIAMVILFILTCLAHLGDFNFLIQWQQATLFTFMTFTLILSTFSLKQQIERYEHLLYLLRVTESIDKLK